MRRAFSLLFVLLFGLGPLTTAFGGGDDAGLPACCRRHGAHHCAMSDGMMARMAEASSGKPIIHAPTRCPSYPVASVANIAPIYALASLPANQSHQPAQLHETAAKGEDARTSLTRTFTVRGPPIPFSS